VKSRFSAAVLAYAGALIALNVILTRFVSIPIGQIFRISIGAVPIILASLWLGPVAGGICGFRILWLLTAFNLSHTLLTLCVCYPLSWVVTDVAIYLYFRHSPVMTDAARLIDGDAGGVS
jgi:ECF transporter S component (folate family)